MLIKLEFSSLRRIAWHEYLTRFLLGGAITVAAGALAEHLGPVIGGLFLAFPAIFPASATLLEKHEEDKKRRAGIVVTSRGRLAAALEARGAALGTIALAAFAFVVWKFLPLHDAGGVLLAALGLWTLLAILTWRLRKLHVYLSRQRDSKYP